MTPELKAFALDLADLLEKHDASIESVSRYGGAHWVEIIGKHDDSIEPGTHIDHRSLRAAIDNALRAKPVTDSSVVDTLQASLA